MNHVLVIDDDQNIRKLVVTVLENAGFRVLEADNGEAALDILYDQVVDLCVVDIMMPVMDGLAFCRQARLQNEDLPLLMLTAKNEMGAKIDSYNTGADDYLVKPFEPEELVLRARALLKRYKKICERTLKVGNLTIDETSSSVLIEGKRQDIPLKEFELLFRLAGQAGKTVSRNAIIEEVWGWDFEGNERTIDVHIGRLRTRFPADTSGIKITTIRGLGYRLEESHGG
ncbi:MAG: response regulator transcription factor [Turicibacter sp.]|nr:response regulator transcription factor [Turicibacter sp.]